MQFPCDQRLSQDLVADVMRFRQKVRIGGKIDNSRVAPSVQLVGVYLVFASLMVPALATRALAKHGLVAGYAIGLVGYAMGLLLSAVYDLPTGAVIVWTLTLAALLGAALLRRAPAPL